MGTQKNATYKVHNGIDFDEINFKTIAEQIKFPDGTTLLDYINSSGDFKLRQKLQSSTLFLELLTSGGFGITIDENGSRIVPKVNKAIDIGSDAYRFKDLWLGDYSITNNGYDKLPNGMLLQMGTATIAGVNGQTVNFPVQFESTIFKVIATVASNNKGTTPVHVWITSKNQANFYARTSEASTIIDWIAIGK